MSIILIGYRGSGKTTLGRRLAERLGHPFVDLDEAISARTGLSIREIFAQHGEAGFRRLESQQLTRVLAMKDTVISLGGGAILAEANRNAIKESGHVVVHLSAGAEELHRRIVADPATVATRPGLTHLGGSVEEVRTLLCARLPLYEEVRHLELDVSNDQIEQLISELISRLTAVKKH